MRPNDAKAQISMNLWFAAREQAFLSGKKARQCRADIGVARRIGAGATACDGRATRRKRQRPIKLAGIHLRQRPRLIRPMARKANNSAA